MSTNIFKLGLLVVIASIAFAWHEKGVTWLHFSCAATGSIAMLFCTERTDVRCLLGAFAFVMILCAIGVRPS